MQPPSDVISPQSDALLTYLLLRWGVTAEQLADTTEAVRVGDVLIYPIFSFAVSVRAAASTSLALIIM
jgi:hypothetical protein